MEAFSIKAYGCTVQAHILRGLLLLLFRHFAVIRQVVAYIGFAYNVEGGTGFIENQD